MTPPGSLAKAWALGTRLVSAVPARLGLSWRSVWLLPCALARPRSAPGPLLRSRPRPGFPCRPRGAPPRCPGSAFVGALRGWSWPPPAAAPAPLCFGRWVSGSALRGRARPGRCSLASRACPLSKKTQQAPQGGRAAARGRGTTSARTSQGQSKRGHGPGLDWSVRWR